MLTTREAREGNKSKASLTPPPMKTGFAVRRVSTELIPITIGAVGGSSPGEMFDDMLRHSARNGEEVQRVEFVIHADDWDQIKRNYGE